MSKSKAPKPHKPQTKKAQAIALLNRKSGTTVSQIAKATGWQAHSIRATLTRLRQQGIEIERVPTGPSSSYRIIVHRAVA